MPALKVCATFVVQPVRCMRPKDEEALVVAERGLQDSWVRYGDRLALQVGAAGNKGDKGDKEKST